MNRPNIQTAISLSAILAALATTGCKTVVRENIISSVDTGIGVTLAENPKTELYEVKVGYIRSQFYSIPTGKTVENEDVKGKGSKTAKNQQDMRSNRADITPELVSGIKTSTSAKHLFLGADVAENFAVGKLAVNSKAAVAMYVAEAQNGENAESAATAVKSVAMSDSYTKDNSGDMLRAFWKPDGKNVDTNNAARITAWMQDNGIDITKVPITLLIRGQLYQEHRKKAVTDMKLEDEN